MSYWTGWRLPGFSERVSMMHPAKPNVFTLTLWRAYGDIRLRVCETPEGRAHYTLFTANGPRWHVLLELGVDLDGRTTDYLRLDRFWGHVPRPLEVYDDNARTSA